MDDNSMLWFNIIHGIITALATIVLAYITYHYLKETRKIRETSQETLRVANTPDVRMFLGNINGVGTVYTIDLCITSQETLRVANTPDVRMFLGNINGVGTVSSGQDLHTI